MIRSFSSESFAKDLRRRDDVPSGTSSGSPAAPLEISAPTMLSIDKIDIGEWNPRTTRNEAWEDLKASIRAKGIEQTITLTQRPGSDRFILKAGGKTRIQILLELLEETGDDRYSKVPVVIKPWQGEIDFVVGTANENTKRGALSFYDQAMQEKHLRETITQEDPDFENASLRQRQDRYETIGYGKISRQYLTAFSFILDVLAPHIPSDTLSQFKMNQFRSLQSSYRFLLDQIREAAAVDDDTDEFTRLFIDNIKTQSDNYQNPAFTFDSSAFEVLVAQRWEINRTPEKNSPSQNTAVERSDDASQPASDTSTARTGKAPAQTPAAPPSDPAAPRANSQSILPANHTLEEARLACTSIASELAIEAGLIGGAFSINDNLGLGFALEPIEYPFEDNQSLPLATRLLVYVELYALSHTTLELEIAEGHLSPEYVAREIPARVTPLHFFVTGALSDANDNGTVPCHSARLKLLSSSAVLSGVSAEEIKVLGKIEDLTAAAQRYLQIRLNQSV